jgi:uncharacterized protein YndB with AHSA1/START domain
MTSHGQLDITTPSEREITMAWVFDAPRRLVFDAWTRPELLQRWLLGPPGWSMPVCEVDLRVGGRYRYVWRSPDGAEMGMGGVHRELAPPERLVCTQLFDQDWTGGETLGTLVLAEEGGRTTVTNTVRYPSQAVRDAALATGMARGVEAGFLRLDEVLKTMLAQGGA